MFLHEVKSHILLTTRARGRTTSLMLVSGIQNQPVCRLKIEIMKL